MGTIEILLWLITAITIAVMFERTSNIAISGVKFWLHPSPWLILRIPIFLIALVCIFGGIELVYDINARAWFSESSNGVGFRWWMLLFMPIVLSVASLGFTIPYLAYFMIIPNLQQSKRFNFATRSVLSAFLILGIPSLIYAVMYLL